MRLVPTLAGLLCLLCGLSAGPSVQAAEVSLFNGLPHRVEVVRILEDGGEHRPWSGPMEPGSRWRLSLPTGSRVEFRRDGGAVALLQVGPEAKQGHVIRLPGVKGPTPPPPPRGQLSEFPNWRRSTRVQPVPAGHIVAETLTASRLGPTKERPPVCEKAWDSD